jgi:NADPH:quinone reductase-like Zn-dependent oxidoreductase
MRRFRELRHGRVSDVVHLRELLHRRPAGVAGGTRTGQRCCPEASRTFDVIFDVAGKSSFGRCRKALNPDGIYLTTAPSPALFAQAAWTSKFGRRKAAIAFTGLRPAAEKLKDLQYTSELIEAGALTAVIEERFPLDRIGDAHRRVEAGRKSGNVIVVLEAPI